jgi:CHAT domain-containing protein
VFADPVFDRRDPRLRGAGEPAAAPPATTPPATTRPAGVDLPRLRTSRREAEIVAALARADRTAPEEALVALDFAADRDLALDPRLARYRILHFATHGVIDARYPALSGLVLSLFDEEGRPRDGFLGLRDIYGLQLDADLVVLSACRTALGKEVRGEGLVGLTRGFLHAGASRVLASLWPVSDRATTELMARFYRALFEDHLSPAAALRRAQLSMLGERRWRDPHGWAGFVLLGDWQTTNPAAR